MKKLVLTLILLFTLITAPSTVFAQGMMGNDGHTAQEEVEGKEIWEKMQAKQLECKDLADDHYAALGEYFMGQAIGDTQRHAVMNQMMTGMMGEKGEEQMHTMMGKRLSGCDTSAQVLSGGGENSMMGNFGVNPMGTFGWGFGWIFMILFWGMVILVIVALIKWIVNQGKSPDQSKSAADILKERYAKGEINKKEFEEKKRDVD